MNADRYTRWSLTRSVALVALSVFVVGLASAQAPVEATSLSPDVLLVALGGSGSAFEIGFPNDVHVVHIAVTRGDTVVDSRSATVAQRHDDRPASMIVSVGALGPTARCPLLVFMATSETRDGSESRHGMSMACIEIPTTVRLAPSGRFLPTSLDVERWHVVDGVMLIDSAQGAQRSVVGSGRPHVDELVFHVYLVVDDAPAPVDDLDAHPR